MQVARKRAVIWCWLLSLMVGLWVPFQISQSVQADEAVTATLGSDASGSVTTRYQVNREQHTIDWEVTLKQSASEEDRQMEFGATGENGLANPSGLQISGGEISDQNGQKVGSASKDERTYVGRFKTTYDQTIDHDVTLKVHYQIFKAADHTGTLLTVDQPVTIGKDALKTAEKDVSQHENSAENDSKKDTSKVDSTSNVVESQSSSAESVVSGEPTKTEASVAEATTESQQKKKTTQGKQSESKQSKSQKTTTKSEPSAKRAKDTKAWSANGKVMVDGVERATLNFVGSSNSNTRTISGIKPDSEITFEISWQGVVGQIEYRTDTSDGWQLIQGSTMGDTWTGKWSDIGQSGFEESVKTESHSDGRLSFKSVTTRFVQFRVPNSLPFFPTLNSETINLVDKQRDFSLTVPKMDFGRIEQFGQTIKRQFNFALANPENTCFTLKATNEPSDSADDNPFGSTDMLGFNGAGSPFMDPDHAVTLVHQQTTIANELPFSVNVPLNKYKDGDYSTKINWQLTLDN